MKKNIKKTKDQLTYDAYFREWCFIRLVPCLGAFFLLYIVLLGVNLTHVLERSHTLSTINSFKRDHAEVERQYLSLVEELDRKDAQENFGLTEIKEVYFATETQFAMHQDVLPHHVR